MTAALPPHSAQDGQTPPPAYDRTPETVYEALRADSVDLALQAIDEVRNGLRSAHVPAIASIAASLAVAWAGEPEIAAEPPGGYIAGFREGLRRAARAAHGVADECHPGSDAEQILRRVAVALHDQSAGEIRLDKDAP